MSLDSYQLCPCGSGKKLKFCCAALTEVMEKVQAAQEKGNQRQAKQLIEKHYDADKPVPWVCIAQASMLIEQGNIGEARKTLKSLLKQNPEHPAGIGLYAMTAALSGKFQESKSVIYNVFQSGSALLPDLASEVASAVSSSFAQQKKWMAARAYLVLAMKLAPQEAKQDCFYELMSFDANYVIPYPLRSVQHIAPFSGTEAENKEIKKAHKLSDIGCYAPAARIYGKLAEQHPDEASLHKNAGLCHAWDGDEANASKALHLAAELTANREDAVELETISQLLAWSSADNQTTQQTSHYDVDSIAKLLTVVSEQDCIQRVQETPQNEELNKWIEASFEVLDRPKLTADQATNVTIDDIPVVQGELLVLKENELAPNQKRVVVLSDTPDRLQTTIKTLQDVIGSENQLENEELNPKLDGLQNDNSFPVELSDYFWRWSFPPKFPAQKRSTLFQEKWEKLVYEEWSEKPQSILNNQKPNDLEDDSTQKQAALFVLDAISGQRQLPFDLEKMHEQLGLLTLSSLKPDDDHSLSSLTAMQFNRLDFSDLGDEEMLNVMNRALLTHYSPFLEEVLNELLNNRPSCEGKFDRFRAYRTLSQIAIYENDEAKAINAVHAALAEAEKLDNSFEQVFEWKLRKLTILLRDPHREEVAELVRSMQEFYGAKIPEFRTMLSSLQADFNLDPGIFTAGAQSAPTSNEGVWSPDQPATKNETDKKIWLPGQD